MGGRVNYAAACGGLSSSAFEIILSRLCLPVPQKPTNHDELSYCKT